MRAATVSCTSVLCSVSVLMSCCHGDRVSGGGARGGSWMMPLLNARVYNDVTYVLLVLYIGFVLALCKLSFIMHGVTV